MVTKLRAVDEGRTASNQSAEVRARIGMTIREGVPRGSEAFHLFLRNAQAGEHFCYGHSAAPLSTSTKALARFFYEKGYVALVQKREGAVTYYLAQRTSRPFAG